jgi:tRNA pseudouridine32 synthase/23S rRNA pseudouridine746 synthase
MSEITVDCFTRFKQPIDGFKIPDTFTFPFYYDPNPLAELAAKELQVYLTEQTDWEHNFGLNSNQIGLEIGKMFGVLVVETMHGDLGYLAAFSGKLAGENHHKRFVPPVFDILTEDGLFRRNEELLNAYNRQIEALEQDTEFLSLKSNYFNKKQHVEEELKQLKHAIKQRKKERQLLREEALSHLVSPELENRMEELRLMSVKEQYFLKAQTREFKKQLEEQEAEIADFQSRIQTLKEERKTRSAAVQQELFNAYYFLNIRGESKSLRDIFTSETNSIPPAGAGECAAPKLLHYAFLHRLKPIALAEFWWGKSPSSEIRKHRHFYPSCRGKCEPILSHMLSGMKVDENPMLSVPSQKNQLPIIYEDEYITVLNKPEEFLSVPGIHIEDSVYARMKQMYPTASGPLLVHRLDMSTSGILLVAKNKEIHKKLQSQFIKRTIKKYYVALLDGILKEEQGVIDLPLRVDLDDRPRQLVCYEHGKQALTHWKVIERFENHTKVQFEPVTGRTHQLRVHAAHPSGLNTPIVGDDLYGHKASRLHLHASFISFIHPHTHKLVSFQCKEDF